MTAPICALELAPTSAIVSRTTFEISSALIPCGKYDCKIDNSSFSFAASNNVGVVTRALEQTVNHTTWPELDEQIAAKIEQSFHAIDPADCAGDLVLQRLANFCRRFHFLASHIANHRESWRVNWNIGQRFAEFF